MAQVTFDLMDQSQVAFIRNLLNGMNQSSAPAAPVHVPAPASAAVAPQAPVAPIAPAPVAPQAPVAPVAPAPAAQAAGRDVSNPALQALVQDLVQNKGVQIPQILGVLQGLGAANISSLADDKRMDFVTKVEALVG